MEEFVIIDETFTVSYKVEDDFIFLRSPAEVYYLISDEFILIRLKLSVKDFYDKYFEHIDKNISFLSLIEENFVLVENFLIKKDIALKEVCNEK